MKEYRAVQIIKHALRRYIERLDATEKDIKQEKQLLAEYERRAETLKKRYGINNRRQTNGGVVNEFE